MEKIIRQNLDDGIVLNNAHSIVKKFETQGNDFEENFFTLVQGNKYTRVDVTDSNISNNARFIVDLWD